MNEQRLKQLIAAYGAEPARWPAGERAEAEALARRMPELLQEAQDLDTLLAAAPSPPIDPQLAARIAAAAARTPQQRRFDLRAWLPTPLWPRLAGLAAAGLAGLAIGISDVGVNAMDAVDQGTELVSLLSESEPLL